eukprot:CAMPEP_0178419292 /NCGR_PEP_ID=MMETSP0689_2-20121128/25534_1 /TAXON_ID=160604 /ORGANISM="Amphidinium massartii, Strain CS-259" /LENGTH=468 /DNA_ID=CAMNT_0020040723 /DNA_START=82 /DNA_END=1488 /DNA_ORIENTATION=-
MTMAVAQVIERLTTWWKATRSELRHWFEQTTDAAFIRSEINGRQSRRVVLVAFFITDVIGANLWASWCTSDGDHMIHPGFGEPNACNTFGVNQYIVLILSLPIEGAALFMAGWRTWSFWSDGFLLPVWLIRLSILDVALWNSDPATLVGDALWFSVLAVMCRVHSLALVILVATQVSSLYLVLAIHGFTDRRTFELVRYGHYNSVMLLGVAGAYITDELSRVRCFSHLMALQDNSSDLAETMIRWKVLTEDKEEAEEIESPNPHALLALRAAPWASLWQNARPQRSIPSLPDESSWSSDHPGFAGILETSAALEAGRNGRGSSQDKGVNAMKEQLALVHESVARSRLANSDKRKATGKKAGHRVAWWDSLHDLVPTSRPRKGLRALNTPPSQVPKASRSATWSVRHPGSAHLAPAATLSPALDKGAFAAPPAAAAAAASTADGSGKSECTNLSPQLKAATLDVLDVLE